MPPPHLVSPLSGRTKRRCKPGIRDRTNGNVCFLVIAVTFKIHLDRTAHIKSMNNIFEYFVRGRSSAGERLNRAHSGLG